MNINPDQLKLKPEEEPRRNEIAEEINLKITANQADPRLAGYSYPKTSEEWWGLVELWWPELKTLIFVYAQRLLNDAENAKHTKNLRLASILETAWINAPDHGSIHATKGWNVLCDLCSESGVLIDRPEEL